MLPPEFLQELLSRVDIVDVIHNQVPLKKYGREFRAGCPFHTERTPSFYVIPAKQFYHCFGCGESGNAISFLMNYSNLRFMDAVEDLASIAGMEIPRNRTAGPSTGNTARLLQLMEEVQAAYKRELLQSDPESHVKSYLKNRGYEQKCALRFGLGFAPERCDFILKKFGRSDSDRSLLRKAGLVIQDDKGRESDRFRNRLMFPIHDRRGRVIAFGGRSLDSSEPKYLNSPETVLFGKHNEPYGLFHAAKAIKDEGKAIIVEGYADVLSLHQAGIENAVATPGTETTTEHVRELFQATDHIVYCFSAGKAGRISAWRSMLRVLPEMQDGRLVDFVFLPEGHDPDSFVRQNGAAEFQQLISESEPMEDFMFRLLASEFDASQPNEKARLCEHMNSIYRALPDTVFRMLVVLDFTYKLFLSDYFVRSA